MRAVVQRVSRAEVRVDGRVVGRTPVGLLVLVGAGKDDSPRDVDYLVDKILNLRIFEDEFGKMNRSVLDVRGGLLVVSQFTLYGDARKGRRPSFVDALEPVRAKELCDLFAERCRAGGAASVEAGEFGAMMEVDLVNWGPVTILLDSHRAF